LDVSAGGDRHHHLEKRIEIAKTNGDEQQDQAGSGPAGACPLLRGFRFGGTSRRPANQQRDQDYGQRKGTNTHQSGKGAGSTRLKAVP